MQNERRASERYVTNVPCKIIHDGIQVNGKLFNISREGIGLEGELPFLSAGETLQIEIDTGQANTSRYIELELEIKNSQDTNLATRFGTYLKEITDNFIDFFEQVIKDSLEQLSPFRRAAQITY